MRRCWMGLVALAGVGLFGPCPLGLAKETKVDVAAVLAAFSKAWPSDRADYRSEGDDSWKAYARTLRTLVGAADAAALGAGLKNENRQVRALSARALGYLSEGESVNALARVLTGDEWPTVRLLAADSLGAIATPAARKALSAAQRTEKKGDVLLHIDVALRRKEAPGKDFKKALLALRDSDLEPLQVGKPAPAFSLETPEGKRFSLADYRGKKHVVLVFIYGDG